MIKRNRAAKMLYMFFCVFCSIWPTLTGADNVTAVLGATVWLPCRSRSSGDFVWKKKQDLLTHNLLRVTDDDRFSVIKQNAHEWNLQITDIRLEDAGEYSCKFSMSGRQPSTESSVLLLVLAPPRVVYHSNLTVSVTEGGNVTLFCNASGYPQPYIFWYILPTLKRHGSHAAEGSQKLVRAGESFTIVNASRNLAGIYKCIASNGVAPNGTASIALSVHYSPKVMPLSPQIGQVTGRDVVIGCEYLANPPAKLVWYRNWKPILPSPDDLNESSLKYEMYTMNDDLHHHLRITRLEANDFGPYQCVANNGIGTSNATIVVYRLDSGFTHPPTSGKPWRSYTTSYQRHNIATNIRNLPVVSAQPVYRYSGAASCARSLPLITITSLLVFSFAFSSSRLQISLQP